MTDHTNTKCRAIIEKIVEMCGEESGCVSFSHDWGGNSITIDVGGRGHSHAGQDDGTFEHLVDELHGLLCLGRGLSFVAGLEPDTE